ncbi:hypothetical protein CVN76_24050 [Bacillus sp. mrc49]|nr:hypothetical protein CVN76_24050 [Bacillus sp. mrc49]
MEWMMRVDKQRSKSVRIDFYLEISVLPIWGLKKRNRKICNIKVKKVIKFSLEMICQLKVISIQWKWFYVTTIDKECLEKYEYIYYYSKHR